MMISAAAQPPPHSPRHLLTNRRMEIRFLENHDDDLFRCITYSFKNIGLIVEICFPVQGYRASNLLTRVTKSM